MKKISYYKIRSVDYISDFASGAIIILPLMFYGLDMLFGSQPDPMLILVPILGGIIVLSYRMYFFYSLYQRGVNVSGQIVYAHAFKRGGSRVEYKYEYQGEKYWRGNALTHKTFFRHDFRAGDEVILMIDSENPKRAVIKDIYF